MNIKLALLFCAILFAAPLSARDKTEDMEQRILLFERIIDIVKREHIKPKDDDALFKAAVNGMLSSLDPHSAWLDPETYKNMQISTKGKFGGLGIEVTMDKGYIRVVAPIAGTPAEQAGILAGDLITHLDGKSVMGLTLANAVQMMRGKPKTKIALTVKREGRKAPLKIEITRAIIEIKAVSVENFGRVAYFRLSTFNERAAKNLKQAIQKTQKEYNPQGYILDLRNNPGGLLDQAVSVADLFLQKGEIVSIRGRSDMSWAQISDRYYARKGDITNNQPLIVLINGGSASASEIVAGALQDHHRAIALGTLSFGKGSVQTVRPLGRGNGALRLTTARYYTPLGRSIQARGVLPDIIIHQKLDKEEKERLGIAITGETDLPGHLDSEQRYKRSGSASYLPKDRNKDTQLNYALGLLNGVIAASSTMRQTNNRF